MRQKGQVILILVLIMTVALAVGISVVQRSLSDVSTATKIEQSSRAFSAAEAGIEKALKNDASGVDFTVDNNSSATVSTNNLVPGLPTGYGRQDPIECPPGDSSLPKEGMAQVWLANPQSTTNPPEERYKANELDVYWGNSSGDKAALAITVVYYQGGEYKTNKYYFDHNNRVPPLPAGDGFTTVDCPGNIKPAYSDGTTGSTYQCSTRIKPLPAGTLILLRARLLLNETEQPFAVQAVGTCGRDCSIPPQAKLIESTGTSGDVARKIKFCQTEKVVPAYFDYAIFSMGEINK
ncbi:pilus assembly PilX N-terminal domain-containing protein [Candidatus Daviesbacteria bacterium]|nr:pilus assembly PilX N-terminal domain-containing protein [Candidatus Daviesbacteria bacterium]